MGTYLFDSTAFGGCCQGKPCLIISHWILALQPIAGS
jgi:hypothetical protein